MSRPAPAGWDRRQVREASPHLVAAVVRYVAHRGAASAADVSAHFGIALGEASRALLTAYRAGDLDRITDSTTTLYAPRQVVES